MGQKNADVLSSSLSSRRSFHMLLTKENLRETLEEKGLACRDMIAQFNKLQNAKQVAFEQASIVMQEKLDDTIRQLKKEAETMQKELKDKHETDISEIKTIKERLTSSLTTLDSALMNLSKIQAEIEKDEDDAEEQRDSGYSEDDLESNNSDDSSTSQEIPKFEDVKDTLESLTQELPGSLWTYRSVHRFVPCASEKEYKLGVFQECFLGEDYTKVTKYSYDSAKKSKRKRYLDDMKGEGRVRGHSFTGKLPHIEVPYKTGTLRRAKSDVTLKQTMTIYPISLDSFKPYQNPVLKYNITSSSLHDTLIPIGIAFLPNDNIIIADKETGSLNIYSHDDGNPTQTINPPKLQPKGVNITKDGYIITTDGWDRNLKAFTRGGEMVCKFGTGYFKNPSIIAVDSKDNYLVIDNRGPWQTYVYHYTPMTGVMTKIGYDASEMLIISNPECVVVGSNDNIFVTDSANHCVFVFSRHGNMIRKFGCQGDGDGQFSYPKGVCVDSRDNVFVVDCGNHRVSMFDKHGEFVRHLLTKKDGLHFPKWIVLNENTNTLLISQDRACNLYQV